jgi:hypothetical protein
MNGGKLGYSHFSMEEMGIKMNIMAVRKWTWQWLALIGVLGLIFHAITWTRIQLREPISVFYNYPYSEVVLASK